MEVRDSFLLPVFGNWMRAQPEALLNVLDRDDDGFVMESDVSFFFGEIRFFTEMIAHTPTPPHE